MNRVSIIGNVGKDPETRRLNSGDEVANFSVAVTERWKDKQSGERKERTEWIPVTVYGPLVRVVGNYVRKGTRLLVEGKFQTRSWEKYGTKHYKTEVVLQGFNANLELLSSKDDGDRGDDRGRDDDRSSSGGGRGGGGRPSSYSDAMDDDIPFAPEWR